MDYHQTYGCGCGQPTVSQIIETCDNCIIAPTIRWGCDVGPAPDGTLTFSIPEVANIKLPTGYTYVYELYDFDSKGFNSVTVSSVGVVVAKLHKVYKHRKEYRLRYKIIQEDGIMSKTGEVFVCMRNLCKDCTGNCDPLEGDCVEMNPIISNAECGLAWTQAVPNWNLDGVIFEEVPICFTNIAYNSGPKTVTATLLNYGCAIGVPLKIKVKGIRGAAVVHETITVTIQDKSIGVICGPYQIANKCTGVCEAVSVDLEVSNGQQQPDLSVQ